MRQNKQDKANTVKCNTKLDKSWKVKQIQSNSITEQIGYLNSTQKTTISETKRKQIIGMTIFASTRWTLQWLLETFVG